MPAMSGRELAPGADVLVMVKPQFEVDRDQVGKGGVVRDPALRDAAADRVRGCAEFIQERILDFAGRGIKRHLTINSPSGKLGETGFDKNDKAAHVCPVGAILSRSEGFNKPIGQRLYDKQPISVVGDVAAHDET